MRIPIVNEQDEIIKIIDSTDRQKSDICRVSALWVTDRDGNVLLAQRSFSKKFSPGLWGPAVAGTLEEGETYESNILKEAQEEINLVGIKPNKENKTRMSTTHEYFCQWFSVVVDGGYPFVKQDSEVEKVKWFTKEELLKLFADKPEIFVQSFKYLVNYFIKHANQS
ncbi:MAG: NUDIX hydrolase [Candidatus Paceibacterota bacterium]|jgi:isopentenyldiphosphate isomerase